MCVITPTAEPQPNTTNVGVGQCAGAEGAGAEIHTNAPHHTLIPASVAAAGAGTGGDGDGAAAFDLLFATGSGDYSPCGDMAMVMQEFVADPEGRSGAVRRVREDF